MTSSEQQPSRAAPGRPRRGDRAPITRTQVIEEALRLIDDGGAGALTMRQLAQRLGIEAMSLYAYVANKNDLLDAVATRIASELVLPTVPSHEWQQRIRNAVTAWARMQEDHPGGFPLLYRSRLPSSNESLVTEEILDALATAGLHPAAVALAYQTLISFLDGALLNWPPSAWGAPAAWRESAGQIDSARYPRSAQTAPHAAALRWGDVFYTGLDLLLRGLEDQLGHQKDSAPRS